MSEKPQTESVNNWQHKDVFPAHEVVMKRIRHDILLKDSYKHRVVDKTGPCKAMQKSKLKILSQSNLLAKQQLKALTQQELIDFIEELAYVALSQQKVDSDLLKIVEDECCLRAKSMDSAEMLLVADAFFLMRYQRHCSRYYSAMFHEFEHRWICLLYTSDAADE